MELSIDFGGSTIDTVFWAGGKSRQAERIRSFERKDFFKDHDLAYFFKRSRLDLKNVTKIFVTGGKSRFFPKRFHAIPLLKIPEIEAIGRGGHYLIHHDKSLKQLRTFSKILIVSMGTGTCLVELRQRQGRYQIARHLGGTGIGGGTFLGLAQALLGQVDIQKLKKLFNRGDKSKVDLSVYDLIGAGIGFVPGKATASNLAKLNQEIDFAKADIAAGIVNLIGQTIGMVSIFAAKAAGCSAIVLTGKLTRIGKILDVIRETGQMYRLPMFLPQEAAYVSALGAHV